MKCKEFLQLFYDRSKNVVNILAGKGIKINEFMVRIFFEHFSINLREFLKKFRSLAREKHGVKHCVKTITNIGASFIHIISGDYCSNEACFAAFFPRLAPKTIQDRERITLNISA